jgi:hypothetical protein
MDTAFVDDLVVISRPNLPVFPVFFPVIRKFEFGDWFESNCIVSQPVRSPESSPTMSLRSPPLAGWTKETVMTNDAGMAGNAVWAAGEYGLLESGEVAGKQTGGHFGWVLVRDGDAWHIAMLTANVTPPK